MEPVSADAVGASSSATAVGISAAPGGAASAAPWIGAPATAAGGAGPSPLRAGLLSWLFPGLGQLAMGRVHRGLAFVVPATGMLVVAAGLILGRGGVLEGLLSPDVLAGLLVLNLALATARLGAIVDAWRLATRRREGPPRSNRLATLALAATLLLTAGFHGAIGGFTFAAREALQAVFVPPGGGWAVPGSSLPLSAAGVPPAATASVEPAATPVGSGTPTGSPTATEPPPTPTPDVAPIPTPTGPAWATDGRLNVLLIGSDAGPDRWSLRTDTVIVLSIDVATGRAALFGIPRNMVGVPLPPESARAFANGQFPGLLNALYAYAMGHPAQFPGGDARGFRAVAGAIQELVGVPLDGVIVVNLQGFVQLVDAVGGLWIDIRETLVDSAYPLEDGSGYIALNFRLGCQRLNGRMALAYSRSRRQDSDYGRMRRQQDVLAALARQVKPIDLVPRVPDLLRIARNNIWTTLSSADVADMAELAARVSVDRLQTVRFVPSRYPERLNKAGIESIRTAVRTIFEGEPPARRSDLPRRCP
jgi:LCP family protein required for cell wall assembly